MKDCACWRNHIVGLGESELNARGDHVRPSNGQRSLKRESSDFGRGGVSRWKCVKKMNKEKRKFQ